MMASRSLNFLCFFIAVVSRANSFGLTPNANAKTTTTTGSALASCLSPSDAVPTRREFASKILAGAMILTLGSNAAHASGGATAGGAYLLSAKQRYNERVTKSIGNLIVAVDALGNGSSAEAKEYFSGEDTGTWKDLTSAGYLLSNAFRRNSTAAPDSLPSVKKWKAFVAEVENLQKLLKKKGAAAAAGAVPTVEEALTVWLAEIDLPGPREL